MRTWEKDLTEGASDPEIAKKVQTALRRLLTEDQHLLQADANERSISHRLAVHLGSAFPEWDVDCEYNRDEHEPKRLQLEVESVQSDDVEGRTVYPDIIVHKRGTARNLLAIEIKKTSSRESKEPDLRKLRALRSQLKYRHGLFLLLRMATADTAEDSVAEVSWIR